MSAYEALLVSIRSAKAENAVNEMECRLKLALIHQALGRFVPAVEQCDAILGWTGDAETVHRLEDHRQAAEQIRMRCLGKSGLN